MSTVLSYININSYTTYEGKHTPVNLSYQVFGPRIGNAPVVLVTHALTGNSQVTGENGWWNSLIGPDQVIDTNKYTIVAFNIPGNGYDGLVENLFEDYKIFTAKDVARIFSIGLEKLGVTKLFANVGAVSYTHLTLPTIA